MYDPAFTVFIFECVIISHRDCRMYYTVCTDFYEEKQVNRITEVTKRDIYNLFKNGLEIDAFFETRTVSYLYFGQLEEVDFLKRLYALKDMPSSDLRYKNAEQDIRQHIDNNDYPNCWVFEDERFLLQNGDDETYLKFLCEIFHPAVRYEKGYWKDFLEKINSLLRNDGYELYPAEKLSNRDVYKWRIFQQEESTLFVPFSQRNSKAIKEKKIVLSINRKARNQIYQFLERCNFEYQATNDTGLKYYTNVAEDVFYDMRQFYMPKCFNSQNEYVETNDLRDFIFFSTPYSVLDAIEFFARHSMLEDFEAQINTILKLNDITFRFSNGKIVNSFDEPITRNSIDMVEEAGLKELLQEASKYYNANNMQIAVEKLWDAFERLKSYYCSLSIDKKESINRIIQDMGNSQQEFIELFDKEFRELTIWGNKFRIRHHETTKIDIQDKRHLEYFYKRCLTLITTAIEYLEGRL